MAGPAFAEPAYAAPSYASYAAPTGGPTVPRSPFATVPAYRAAPDPSPAHSGRPASGRLVSVG